MRDRATSDDAVQLAKMAREIEDLCARCDAQDAVIAELWAKLFQDDPPIEKKEGATLGRWRPAKMLADQLGCTEGLLRYYRKAV
jgi:hypothetical protein